MIRNIANRYSRRQVAMPIHIPPGDNCLVDMNRVLGKEPIAPVVQSLSLLCRPSSWFKLSFVESESEVCPSHGQGWDFRFLGKGSLPTLHIVSCLKSVACANRPISASR